MSLTPNNLMPILGSIEHLSSIPQGRLAISTLPKYSLIPESEATPIAILFQLSYATLVALTWPNKTKSQRKSQRS